MSWNKEEIGILNKITVPFDINKDLSDDELEDLFSNVDDYIWTHEGYDGIGEPEPEFLLCERIMDKIEDVLKEHGLVNKEH